MSFLKKFFSGLLVIVLVAVIVGGIGYIGYSYLFMDHNMAGMNMNTSNSEAKKTDKTADSSKESSQNNMSMNMDMNMSQNSGSSQDMQNSGQQSESSSIGLNQANIVLQNKENLGKSIAALNDAIKLMTVDPYAPSSDVGTTGSMQTQQGNNQTNSQSGSTPATTSNTPASANQGGNNTTINIYPPSGINSNTQPSTMQQNGMQNMGTTYDPNKMEQLHNGLYKISVGMALLDQLDSALVSQAEISGSNTQDPVQYYSNQYNLTVSNKNKLNQALTDVNEAANLININPYVGANGLIYDKNKMNQIHQSVVKFAQGVALLNLLNDEFTKQTINLSNTVQNYINNANANNMNMSQMNMSSGLFGGLFQNISMSSVVNIILIIFVLGLLLGVFGFIFSMIKPASRKNDYNKNEEIV